MFRFLRRTEKPVGGDGARSSALIGQTLGDKYRVLEVLGEGGFGTVFKARHTLLERDVALKVIHPRLVTENAEAIQQRFETEARLTSQVDHPNAITVYDYGFHDDTPYLVMEYLDGRPLNDDDLLLPESLYPIARQVGSALGAAHALGIVHLDLKPANVMIIRGPDDEEFVKVLDFGIARLIEPPGGDLTDADLQPREVVGTPPYMAPEQIRGRPVDPRTDIYALGVMLYRLLSGHFPYPDLTGMPLLLKKISEDPVPLNQSSGLVRVSDELNRVIMTAMQRDPDRRYGSILSMMAELRRAIYGVDPRADRQDRARPSLTMDEMLNGHDAARRSFDRGDYRAAFERLDGMIAGGAVDPQLIHLAVLSLARGGATDRGYAYLDRYRELMPPTEDYLALNARLLKDRFVATESGDRARLGRAARDAYLKLHEKTGGYYPTINAATLSLLIGDTDQARELAGKCLELTRGEAREDYWLCATRAEAHLILGQTESVRADLEQALGYRPSASDQNTTFKQLALICERRGLDSSMLRPIAPPSVLCCHSDWAPDSRAGLDTAAEARLKTEVQRAIDEHRIGFVYLVAATATDIVVAEAIVGTAAGLSVWLPFERQAFRRAAIEPLGGAWPARFDAVLRAAHSVGVFCDAAGPALEPAVAAVRRHARGLALLQADKLAAPVVLYVPAGAADDPAAPHRHRPGLERIVSSVELPRSPVSTVATDGERWLWAAAIAVRLPVAAAGAPDDRDPAPVPGRRRLIDCLQRHPEIERHGWWNHRHLFVTRDIEPALAFIATLSRAFADTGQPGSAAALSLYADVGLVRQRPPDPLDQQPLEGEVLERATERLLDGVGPGTETSAAFDAAVAAAT